MKQHIIRIRILFLMILVIGSGNYLYSDEIRTIINSYENGNGHIIDNGEDDKSFWETRSHVQQISIGGFAKNYNKVVFKNPDRNSELIQYLRINDKITINSIRIYQDKKNESKSYWMNIDTESENSGWIEYGSDPYKNDSWIIIEKISSKSKIWTVRKFEGEYFYVAETLNVRDIPGLSGSSVLFQLRPDKTEYDLGVRTLAITEETEVIDGMDEPWLKITDPNGRTGWIFAGYARSDRGGSKYRTPDRRIAFSLGGY